MVTVSLSRRRGALLSTVFLVLTLAVLLPVVAYGDLDESADALTSLRQRVHFETLENGVRVVLYERGTAPVFSGVVGVRVGGVDEPLGMTGISHMLEHIAFKGTPEIGTKDYSQEKKLLAELEELAKASQGATRLSAEQKQEWDQIRGQLEELWEPKAFTDTYEERGGTGLNATTGKELTKYFIDLPQSAFAFWCWLESERILRPVFRQFYTERDVVLEERRMRYDDNPGGLLYERLLGVAFLVHPYRNPVIGYPQDIGSLMAHQVRAFHQQYYVPQNIVVSVVGAVSPERDMPVIRRFFGRLPSGPDPVRSYPREPEQSGERTLVHRDQAAPLAYVLYRKPAYPDPDDPAIAVLLDVLAGSRLSPLYRSLVEREGLATDVSGFSTVPGEAQAHLFGFGLEPKPGVGNQRLLAAFDRELDAFRRNGVDPGLLARVKKRIAMGYLSHLRSNSALAQDFVSSELLFDDWAASLEWYDQMVAVTGEDVERVARQYLRRSQRTVAMLEPEALEPNTQEPKTLE